MSHPIKHGLDGYMAQMGTLTSCTGSDEECSVSHPFKCGIDGYADFLEEVADSRLLHHHRRCAGC